MSDGYKIQWAKLGFESALIVVSILVAFAIDSWWSDRQDAAAEQRLLGQLALEFESALAQLDEKQAMHRDARSAALRLVGLTGPDVAADDYDLDQLESDLLWVIWDVTFDPPTGVLSSMISSGTLDLISSENLRIELASWPARYEDLLEDEQAVLTDSNAALGDQFDRHIMWRDIGPRLTEVGPSRFSSDLDGLLRSRQFENSISKKASRLAYLLQFYDQTRQELVHTMDLVDLEMQQ